MDEKLEFKNFIDSVLTKLKDKQYRVVRDELLQYNAADIGEVIEEIMDEIGIDTAIVLFRMLPKDVSVEVFAYLPSEDQVSVVSAITEREIDFIIEELDFDDMIDVLEELPANVVSRILQNASKQERKQINTFLNYPDDCAGTLMTPDYISLHANMTVKQAMEKIKREGMDKETIYTCYVKDEGRKLSGIVSLRTLVISDDSMKISDIMIEECVSINVYDDRENVAEKFKKYGYLALPVVDNESRIVGIITMDDIFEVIEEETTEDIERMVGVVDKSNASYLDTSVLSHVKNRFPWLVAVLLLYILTGAVIAGYEKSLQSVMCLVIYMPMLMGMGGNTGSQSATLIIRSIALGDIEWEDGLKVLWKELRVSVLLGVMLSAVNFVRVVIEQHNDPRCMMIALTICVSTILVVIISKCIGSMLPMLGKKAGIDPALMASPIITSVTDTISVMAFFALSTLFLGI